MDGGDPLVLGRAVLSAADLGQQVGQQQVPPGRSRAAPCATHQPFTVGATRPRGQEGRAGQVIAREVGAQVLAQDERQGRPVRQADTDVAIQPSAPNQSGVQPLRVVAGREHHHAFKPLDAIDLAQQRVDDLNFPVSGCEEPPCPGPGSCRSRR